MSLLLDALKKNGVAQAAEANGQPATSRLTEMSLEELPNRPVPASPAAHSSATNHAPAAAASPSPRSTGENLFAAKKAPVRKKFNYTLGIIPTALIIGTVLGIAGGIYVWIEIQPPKPVQRSSPAPAVAAYSAPAPRTPAPLALPPEKIDGKMPVADPQLKAKPATAAPDSNQRFSRAARTPVKPPATGIQIQRYQEHDSIYTTLTAAYQAYQSGDLNTAWKRYREVLQMDAKNRDALLGMAAIAQQQGQDDVAMQYYRKVLMLDPRDPSAQAGISALSTGDAATRESRLKQSLAQNPQSAVLHFTLGNLYAEQSRWGESQQAYFNAMRLEPENALFAFSLATSLDHMGKGKLAVQYYEQALKTDTTGNSGFDRAQTQKRINQLLAP